MSNTKRFLLIYVFAFSLPLTAGILPILPHPNASELGGPVFLQTFAGLNITSFSGGIGTTEPFFDNTSIPGTTVNILGTFQAFDPLGSPTAFNILNVHVTEGGSTFTPAFGSFDFAGHPSLTFTDSLTFDMVTFNSSDATLAFTVSSGPFQFTIDTDLTLGSSFTFQIVDTDTPEPGMFLLISSGLAMITLGRWTQQRHSVG
jgi:hypothetical protein